MWRWHFAVWETPHQVQQEPEVQSGLTSTKFSPKGRYQASKAYLWACALLGRQIQAGETIDYDPLFPLPCRIKTTKEPGKDFVKVTDVESWPEGQQALAPIKDALLGLRATILQQPPPVIPPAAPPASAATPAPSQPPAPVAPGCRPGAMSRGRRPPRRPGDSAEVVREVRYAGTTHGCHRWRGLSRVRYRDWYPVRMPSKRRFLMRPALG